MSINNELQLTENIEKMKSILKLRKNSFNNYVLLGAHGTGVHFCLIELVKDMDLSNAVILNSPIELTSCTNTHYELNSLASMNLERFDTVIMEDFWMVSKHGNEMLLNKVCKAIKDDNKKVILTATNLDDIQYIGFKFTLLHKFNTSNTNEIILLELSK